MTNVKTAIFQSLQDLMQVAGPRMPALATSEGAWAGPADYTQRIQAMDPWPEEEKAIEEVRSIIRRGLRDSDRLQRVRILGDFGSPRMLEVSCGNLSTGFSRRRVEKVCGDTRKVILACQWAHSCGVSAEEIRLTTAVSVALVEAFRECGVTAEAWSIGYSEGSLRDGSNTYLACKIADPSRTPLARELACFCSPAWHRQAGFAVMDHLGPKSSLRGFPARTLQASQMREYGIAGEGDLIINAPSGHLLDIQRPEKLLAWMEKQILEICEGT